MEVKMQQINLIFIYIYILKKKQFKILTWSIWYVVNIIFFQSIQTFFWNSIMNRPSFTIISTCLCIQ